MRAAVVRRYGPPEVVRLDEVARPVPRSAEVLVRVTAAAVTAADSRIRGARFPPGFGPFARAAFGFRRPRRAVLGGSFAGVVEEVGSEVTDLAPGDPVCGTTGMRMGAHAEQVVVAAARLAPIPSGVRDEDAAGVVFGGTTALTYLRDKVTLRDGSPVGPDVTVLVNGASGSVGTAAVQLARHFGARVTGVTSTANLDLVTELGATAVIDHTTTDLVGTSERFDVVLDTVGNLSIESGRRLLSDRGVLALAVAGLGDTIRARGNVVAGPAAERVEDVEQLLGLVADGTLRVVHDFTCPLDDIVAAHRRVDTGHKVGNVVVLP